VGKYAGVGNLAFMLDFRWVRGKITWGRLLTFNGAGKGLAGNFYTGKVNAGDNPRTEMLATIKRSSLLIPISELFSRFF